MSLFTALSKNLNGYPYRLRLTLVGAFLVLCFLRNRSFLHYDPEEWVICGTIILGLLCSPKRRPFWFFMGIFLGEVIGIVMTGFLTAGSK